MLETATRLLTYLNDIDLAEIIGKANGAEIMREESENKDGRSK